MWELFLPHPVHEDKRTRKARDPRECLTKEALEGFGDFKIGGQIIHTVKYADDLVLLAKEGNVLQKMIDTLIEIGGCYGMEMNVEKTKVMRISKQQIPVKIMIEKNN